MKIGVFDSGYGGLTILHHIRKLLPEFDYVYLGDNARAPYGTRSFERIYQYSWQAVQYLFNQQCALVILACNTASARALRTIQQCNLPLLRAEGRQCNVLGVIRPTVEIIPTVTQNSHVGILATQGTVASESYVIELKKIAPMVVSQQACPMWVPLIENGEHNSEAADYFVQKYIRQLLEKDPIIDTIVLGCTHYPLLLPKIQRAVSRLNIRVVSQGEIVAASLADYLNRHKEYAAILSRHASCRYLTTESPDKFSDNAGVFLNETVRAEYIEL